MSSLIAQKAAQLLSEGRVEPHPVPARVFRIAGDHGSYTVVIAANQHSCTCPHGVRALADRAVGECSHIDAAIQWVLAEADRDLGREDGQIKRFEQALTARKAREHRQAQELFRRLRS